MGTENDYVAETTTKLEDRLENKASRMTMTMPTSSVNESLEHLSNVVTSVQALQSFGTQSTVSRSENIDQVISA